MKNKLFLMCLNVVVLSGCASRSIIVEDNPLKAVSNFYNRNEIVAIPTFVGNIVCGGPFALFAATADKLYSGEKGESYHSLINGVWLVPGCGCGAVTGLPFIPFSYLMDKSAYRPLGI